MGFVSGRSTLPLFTYAAGVLCFAPLVVAAALAVGYYGHPTAAVLVDVGGVVSNFARPPWLGRDEAEATRVEVRFPDVVESVSGVALSTVGGSARAGAWDRAVEHAAPGFDAVIRTDGGPRALHFDVHPLSPLAWWVYGATTLSAGVLYVAAAVIALSTSPGSALARAFAGTFVSSGLFLGLLFDFHTTRHLAPLFLAAYGLVPVAWFSLALRLPDDAPLLVRWPWLDRALLGTGALVAAALVFLYLSGRSTLPLQIVWSRALALGVGGFAVGFVVRFARARGARRTRLRALLVCGAPAVACSLLIQFPVVQASVGREISEAILNLNLCAFPIATAYAFVRYDLWGSRALLSRILTRLAVGALALSFAVAVASALATACGVRFQNAVVAAAFGGIVTTGLLLPALGYVDSTVFPSLARYKPTIERLSAELVAVTSPREVALAVERTVRQFLPCEGVSLVLGALPSEPSAAVHALTLPVEFGGTRVGTLSIGPKSDTALFTEHDLDLLQTIANAGALALAHAHAYEELETRRREEAAAWRGERTALLDTVAAEIAHEIRYPINFFRSLFRDGTGGRHLEAEDVEIGAEEVARLERLVAGLRRVTQRRLERRTVRLELLCDRAETLLRDALSSRRITRAFPDGLELRCDVDQITQVLVNLLSNALHAAGPDGLVGIEWTARSEGGGDLVVWDTGPGFDPGTARLFAPWYTTKPDGTGLGLAISHRLVRAHGWGIVASRRDERTRFVISVREGDAGRTGEAPRSVEAAS